MKKVLIIEDDAILATIYKNRLLKDGYKVDVAADGQSGFYRAHELLPDAILLDVMLPQMDGLVILRKIRAQRQFQKMPIIVYSGTDSAETQERAMEAGATLFFNKTESSPARVCEALVAALSAPPMGNYMAADTTRPTVSSPALSDESDDRFRLEFLAEYFREAPNNLKTINEVARCISQNTREEQRLVELLDMHRDIRRAAIKAKNVGLFEIFQKATAMDAAMEDIIRNRKY